MAKNLHSVVSTFCNSFSFGSLHAVPMLQHVVVPSAKIICLRLATAQLKCMVPAVALSTVKIIDVVRASPLFLSSKQSLRSATSGLLSPRWIVSDKSFPFSACAEDVSLCDHQGKAPAFPACSSFLQKALTAILLLGMWQFHPRLMIWGMLVWHLPPLKVLSTYLAHFSLSVIWSLCSFPVLHRPLL